MANPNDLLSYNLLKSEAICYLDEYIGNQRGTLAGIKNLFIGILTDEVLTSVENVRALVDALESNGHIGLKNVGLLKTLAKKLELTILMEKVDEYEMECSGYIRRTLKAAIHLKTVLSVREVQVALAGALGAALIYKFERSPEELEKLLPFLEFGVKVHKILTGSVVFVLEVSSISTLKGLWQSYKDGSLKEKLKKAINEIKELKEVSQGEEIDVEVTIDEKEYREVLSDLNLMEVKVMASSSWCKETDEKINYTKLCRLLVDGGTQAVRSVFDGIHPPSLLKANLNTTKTTLLKYLKARPPSVIRPPALLPQSPRTF